MKTWKTQKPQEAEHKKKGALRLDDWRTWLAVEDDEAEDHEADGEGETTANA